MRRATSLVTWFALLFVFWELLVGTFQTEEMLAGLIAAAIGTAFMLVLGGLGLLGFGIDVSTAVRVGKLAWQLPVEVCVVTWVLLEALAHGRRVRGSWVQIRYATGPHPLGRGRRALATTAGTAAPNSIVVDLGADGDALLHSLAPNRPGGRAIL